MVALNDIFDSYTVKNSNTGQKFLVMLFKNNSSPSDMCYDMRFKLIPYWMLTSGDKYLDINEKGIYDINVNTVSNNDPIPDLDGYDPIKKEDLDNMYVLYRKELFEIKKLNKVEEKVVTFK